MCPFLWDPVIGCMVLNMLTLVWLKLFGVTSWSNAAGIVSTLDWDCGQNSGTIILIIVVSILHDKSNAMCITIWDPVIGCDGIRIQ